MQLTIAFLDEKKYEIFNEMFSDEPSVNIYHGSIFDLSADALVSPANSFGYMDGGFDQAILDNLGSHIEQRVRDRIEATYHGELPIGACLTVPLDKGSFNKLIIAPTMRVPMDVSKTNNAYMAMRAILMRATTHGTKSIAMTGLCTGIGRMDPYVAATQMKMAYRNVIGGMRYKSFEMAHISEIKMLSPDFTS